MPRIELDVESADKFCELWIKVVKSGHYTAFYDLSKNTMILVPVRSTEPMIYGQVEIPLDGAHKIADKYNLELITVKRWVWVTDRLVGSLSA